MPRQTGRKRTGCGMACAAHINGCFPGSDEFSTVTMRLAPGNRGEIVAALHDLGCGANTTLTQIAAEVLNLSPERFDIQPSDTDLAVYDLGTRASRMTYILGEAVRRAAAALKDEIRREAALLMNCSPEDLILAGGVLRRGDAPGGSLSLAALAERAADRGELRGDLLDHGAQSVHPSQSSARVASDAAARA